MDVPVCAVGRIGPEGPWVGFAPTLDDGYALVVGAVHGSRRAEADADLLLALAIVYFEDAFEPPPDELPPPTRTSRPSSATLRRPTPNRPAGAGWWRRSTPSTTASLPTW